MGHAPVEISMGSSVQSDELAGPGDGNGGRSCLHHRRLGLAERPGGDVSSVEDDKGVRRACEKLELVSDGYS